MCDDIRADITRAQTRSLVVELFGWTNRFQGSAVRTTGHRDQYSDGVSEKLNSVILLHKEEAESPSGGAGVFHT